MTTIDVHAHVGTPDADRLLTGEAGFAAQLTADAQALGPASAAYNREQFATLGRRLTALPDRLAAMDAARVDVQAVSATPIARPWMERPLADRYIGEVNAAVVDFCHQAPDRLAPVATVSLHLPDLAVQQLRAAVVDAGAVGVQISTTAAPGVELDDPSLSEFWETAVALDVPVLIHPWGCSLAARLDVGYMFNHVGNPTETSLALSRLIFGGVLDRFPGLRIWAAHAGGWLPSYSGRADHAWHRREDARTCAHPPSWYLRRMWFDALVYTAPALRFLVDSVGEDHVTIGTDYPFDMGVDDPIDRIEAALSDDAVRAAVTSGSAHGLFGSRLTERLAARGIR
ncbi:amidohydrolase family protein [Microbacterium sp. X-17]|uniref:amidohydrolase family protein n=1 Tax=Microbacterium sp. X-17 TaxID=3144404 RepID=UPI0031F4D61E